jgi:hypothetical protein
MREEIQCLMDWLNSKINDDKPHRILRALAEESLKKADLEEEKRRFTNKDIVAAANEPTQENKANKWVNWNKTVLPYWNTKKKFVIQLAREKGLNSYPELGFYIPEKAGRGNESLYWLKAEPLPESKDNEEKQSSELEQGKARDKSRISFQYDLAENGEVKPIWWAKRLFHDGQILLSRWHIWIIIGWLIILGGSAVALSYISWLGLTIPRPVTTRELTALITIFVLPYTVWIVFIKPWVRLFDDRIVVAPDLLVAMEQKSAQLELFREGDMRMIRLVSYTAPCPICGSTIHLDKGEPDFSRRLVGRCTESPREHIFSFDRVTQKGTSLRGETQN